MAERFETAKGAVKRPNRLWLAIGYAALAAVALAVPLGLLSGLPSTFVLEIALLLGIGGAAAMRRGAGSIKGASFSEGKLAADAHGVSFDGRILARRSEIRQGFVVPAETTTLVRLDRRGLSSPLWLRVADADHGRALLRALGFDAVQTAAEMRVASRFLAMSAIRQGLLTVGPAIGLIAADLVLSIVLPGWATVAGVAVTAVLVAYVFGLTYAPTKVRIGADGLAIRWLGRERFIPFSRVARVKTYSEFNGAKQTRGVRLVLTDGASVKLATGQTDVGDTDAARLARRIDEARTSFGTGSDDVVTAALSRRGRAAVEWVEALRRIGAGASAGMRTAAVPLERLMTLVEDASAPPAVRVSAAVAALASGPEAKDRIRVAAETTASPRLRIALERVSDAESGEEEIAEALEAIADERPRRR